MLHVFTDPRPRNNEGEFAAQETGGIDPQSMSQAYDPNVIAQRKQGLLQRVGAALRKKSGLVENSEGAQAATEMDARITGVLKEFYRQDQPRHSRTRQYADPTEAWARNQNLVNADGSEWKTSSPQLANAVWNKAKKGRIAVVRGSGLVGDAVAVASGKPRERDASGRVKKREWEKAWFRNALVTGGIAAAGGGVLIARRYARTNPGSGVGKFVRKAEAGVHAAKKKAESVAGDILGGIDAAVQPDDKWQRNHHLSMKKSIVRLKEFAGITAKQIVTGIENHQDKQADAGRVILPAYVGAIAGLGGAVVNDKRLRDRLGASKSRFRVWDEAKRAKFERRSVGLAKKYVRASNLQSAGIIGGSLATGIGLGVAWRNSAKGARLAKAREAGLELDAKLALARLREFAEPPTTEVWRALRALKSERPGETFLAKALRERKENDLAKLRPKQNRAFSVAIGRLKEFAKPSFPGGITNLPLSLAIAQRRNLGEAVTMPPHLRGAVHGPSVVIKGGKVKKVKPTVIAKGERAAAKSEALASERKSRSKFQLKKVAGEERPVMPALPEPAPMAKVPWEDLKIGRS